MADRPNKFTEKARLVLTLAEDEAHNLNHNYIGTEHLLLGLVRAGDGVAARVLNNLGVDLARLRSTMEARIGKGSNPPDGLDGLTPRAKRVIELAVEEARNLNHHIIGTEHLLLGLIRENEGIAIGILRNSGIDPENVRNEIIRILNQSTSHKGETEHTRSEKSMADVSEKINKSNRFEVFNESARLVLTRAQEEAQKHHHNFIGTEHILLGLIRDKTNLAVRVLTDMGVEPWKIRSAVEFIIGSGPKVQPPVDEIGLTPRAKTVIDLTVQEARLLNHGYIGPEHILLGLIAESQGIAAGVLSSLNVELEPTRQRVKQTVDDEDGGAFSGAKPFR